MAKQSIKTKIESTLLDKAADDISEVSINVVFILAAFIGIWGVACLFGGLKSVGVVNLMSGFLTAIGL